MKTTSSTSASTGNSQGLQMATTNSRTSPTNTCWPYSDCIKHLKMGRRRPTTTSGLKVRLHTQSIFILSCKLFIISLLLPHLLRPDGASRGASCEALESQQQQQAIVQQQLEERQQIQEQSTSASFLSDINHNQQAPGIQEASLESRRVSANHDDHQDQQHQQEAQVTSNSRQQQLNETKTTGNFDQHFYETPIESLVGLATTTTLLEDETGSFGENALLDARRPQQVVGVPVVESRREQQQPPADELNKANKSGRQIATVDSPPPPSSSSPDFHLDDNDKATTFDLLRQGNKLESEEQQPLAAAVDRPPGLAGAAIAPQQEPQLNSSNDNYDYPKRNLNASLEAEAKLFDTLQQLHVNKTLASVERTPSRRQSNLTEPLAEVADSSGQPNYLDNAMSNLLPAVGALSSNNGDHHQHISVSPTSQPSQVVEYNFRSPDPLEAAADELHDQRDSPTTGRQRPPAATADWGRRMQSGGLGGQPNEQVALEAPKASPYEDIVTWTPAAGPAAYRAGSGYLAPIEANSTGGQFSARLSDQQENNKRNDQFFAPALEFQPSNKARQVKRDSQRTQVLPASHENSNRRLVKVRKVAASGSKFGTDAAYSTQSAKYLKSPGLKGDEDAEEEPQVASNNDDDEGHQDDEQKEKKAKAKKHTTSKKKKHSKQAKKFRTSGNSTASTGAPKQYSSWHSIEGNDDSQPGDSNGPPETRWSPSDTTTTRANISPPGAFRAPPVIKSIRVASHEDQWNHPNGNAANVTANYNINDDPSRTQRDLRGQPRQENHSRDWQPTSSSSGFSPSSSFQVMQQQRRLFGKQAPPMSPPPGRVWPQQQQQQQPPQQQQQQQNWSIVMLPYPRPPAGNGAAFSYFSPAPAATNTNNNADRNLMLEARQQASLLPSNADLSRLQKENKPVLARPGEWPSAVASQPAYQQVRNATVAPVLDMLTINLKTQHSLAVGPNQLFWEAAAREAAAASASQHQQQAVIGPPKVPISNGHLPPQHRELPPSHYASPPLMRRPLDSMRMLAPVSGHHLLHHHHGQQDPFAMAGSHTNGHAFGLGAPLKGHFQEPFAAAAQFQASSAVAPPDPFGYSMLGSFGAGGAESSQLDPHMLLSAYNSFGASQPEESPASSFNQMMAAADAVPSGIYASPSDQSELSASNGNPNSNTNSNPNSNPNGNNNNNQFLKKGAVISAALPLATPAAVRDPYGWPVGFGSQAAKTLVKVNHIAPPLRYLIPSDKWTQLEGQTAPKPAATSMQAGMDQMQMLGSHSMVRPTTTTMLESDEQSKAQQSPVKANVIKLTISTRPPTTAAPNRRERFWSRLRLFKRHEATSSKPTATELPSAEPKRRYKRGLMDTFSQLWNSTSHLMSLQTLRALGRPQGVQASESKVQSQLAAPPGDHLTSNGTRQSFPGAKLALIMADEKAAQAGSSKAAFIPLLDTSNMFDNLESDLLAQSLLFGASSNHLFGPANNYNDNGAFRTQQELQAPLLVQPSMQVASYAPLNSPSQQQQQQQQPARLPSYQQQLLGAQLMAQLELANQAASSVAQQFLEPPANEPGSLNSKQQQQQQPPVAVRPRERIRQIMRSSRKPLDKLMKMTSSFGVGQSANANTNSSTTKVASPSTSQPSFASLASSLQQQQQSMAQQFNNLVSPSIMMMAQSSGVPSSLSNFNRFAGPLQEWLEYQQQASSGLNYNRALPSKQVPQMLPLANHLSQPMSPYSFVSGPPMSRQPPSRSYPVLGGNLTALADERRPNSAALADPMQSLASQYYPPVAASTLAPPTKQQPRTNTQPAGQFDDILRLPAPPRKSPQAAQVRLDSSQVRPIEALAELANERLNNLRRTSDFMDHSMRILNRRVAPTGHHQRQVMSSASNNWRPQPQQTSYISPRPTPVMQQQLKQQHPMQVTTKPSFRFVSADPMGSSYAESTNQFNLSQPQQQQVAGGPNQFAYSDAEIFSSPSDQSPVEMMQHQQQQDQLVASNQIMDSSGCPSGSVQGSSSSLEPLDEASALKFMNEAQSNQIGASAGGSSSFDEGSFLSPASMSSSPVGVEQQQQEMQPNVQQQQQQQQQYFATPQLQQQFQPQQQLFLQPSSGFIGSAPLSLPRPRLPKFSIPSINSFTNKFRQHLMQTFRLNSLAGSSMGSAGGSRWPNMLASPATYSYQQSQQQPQQLPVQMMRPPQTASTGPTPFTLHPASPSLQQSSQSAEPTNFYDYQQQQQPQKTFVLNSNNQQQFAVQSQPRQQQQPLFVSNQPMNLNNNNNNNRLPNRQQQVLLSSDEHIHLLNQEANGTNVMEAPDLQAPNAVDQSVFVDQETLTFVDGQPISLNGSQLETTGAQTPSSSGNHLHQVMTDVSGSLLTSDGTYIAEDQLAEQQQQQLRGRPERRPIKQTILSNQPERQTEASAVEATEEQPPNGMAEQPAEQQQVETNSTNVTQYNQQQHEPIITRNEETNSSHQGGHVTIQVETDGGLQQSVVGPEQPPMETPTTSGLENTAAPNATTLQDTQPGGQLDLQQQHYELERVPVAIRPKLSTNTYHLQQTNGRVLLRPFKREQQQVAGSTSAASNQMRIKLQKGRNQQQQQQPLQRQQMVEVDYQVIKASPSAYGNEQPIVHLSNGTVDTSGQFANTTSSARQYRRLRPQGRQQQQFGSSFAASDVVSASGEVGGELGDSTGSLTEQTTNDIVEGVQAVYEPNSSNASQYALHGQVLYATNQLVLQPVQEEQLVEVLQSPNQVQLINASSQVQEPGEGQASPSLQGQRLFRPSVLMNSSLQYDFKPVTETSQVSHTMETNSPNEATVHNSSGDLASNPANSNADQPFVLIDQPVILTGSQPADSTPKAHNASLAGGEQPAVFVSMRPEKVLQVAAAAAGRTPTSTTTNQANRKRPLKMPSRAHFGSTNTNNNNKTTPVAAFDQRASESSTSQMRAAAKLEPLVPPTSSTTSTTTTTTTSTTRRPHDTLRHHNYHKSMELSKLKNHNLKASATSASISTAAPAKTADSSFTRPPKAKIRWQGASSGNHRMSPGATNRTELSPSETSRSEQAWLVGGMTHQAYGSTGGNLTGPASVYATNHKLAEPSTSSPITSTTSTSTTAAPLNHRNGNGDPTDSNNQQRRDSRTGSTSFRLSSSLAPPAPQPHQVPSPSPSSVTPSSSSSFVSLQRQTTLDSPPNEASEASTPSSISSRADVGQFNAVIEELAGVQQQLQDEQAELVTTTQQQQPTEISAQIPQSTATKTTEQTPERRILGEPATTTQSTNLDEELQTSRPEEPDDQAMSALARARELHQTETSLDSQLRIKLHPNHSQYDDQESLLSLANAKHSSD